MMAKISVAMAVYNGERFLPAQLDSILCQLTREDEIVISYDVSRDGTLDLVCRYEDKYPQVKVIENQNPGIAGNFNSALSACTGDYLFICDQDDVWAKDKRQTVLDRFEKEKCDMVIHNGVHIDEKDSVISIPFFEMYRIGNGKIRNIIKPRYSGCCIAFTRDMAKKILPIPRDIDAYDHWIGTVGEFCGKIGYEEKVLLYHRLHGKNVTVSRRGIRKILQARSGLISHLIERMKREKR